MSFAYTWLWCALLRTRRGEEHTQLDAAMATLGEIRIRRIPRGQARGGVSRWKEDEALQGLKEPALLYLGPGDELVVCLLGFTAVAQDDFAQVDAAPVVAIGGGRAHTPQGGCEKLPLEGAIIVQFVEGGTEVVALLVQPICSMS